MARTNIIVDSRTFTFPDGWLVMKYDETPYYKNKFQGIIRGGREGMKAVDLIAMNKRNGVMYLIESKDYRVNQRKKKIPPYEEFIQKVLDTLTGLIPTALCSDTFNDGEDLLREQLKKAKKLRLVLHFEQPKSPSKLNPRKYDPLDIQGKIRSKLRSIDPHVLVIDERTHNKVVWSIR